MLLSEPGSGKTNSINAFIVCLADGQAGYNSTPSQVEGDFLLDRTRPALLRVSYN